MTDFGDDELRELMALAAVGALDDGDRRQLDAALSGRSDLDDERRDLEAAAAALAFAVAAEPPPALRGRILDAVAELPRSNADQPAPSASNLPAPDGPRAEVVPIGRARRRWMTPLAAAAAVVALLAGAVLVSTQLGDEELDVAAVVADDEAVTIPLAGEISTLRLVQSARYDAVALVGDEVPLPEGDQVYELWLLEDGQPQRVDIFRPGDDGSVDLLVPEMTPPDGAVFAITVEPAGGTNAPTGQVVAASD